MKRDNKITFTYVHQWRYLVTFNAIELGSLETDMGEWVFVPNHRQDGNWSGWALLKIGYKLRELNKTA